MSKVMDAPALTGPDVGGFVNRMLSRVTNLPCAFRVHTQSTSTANAEDGPEFDVYIRNDAGMRALQSLEELTIAEAYVRGDLDIEGDVVKAMWLRTFIDDKNLWLKIWRRLQPKLLGREKLNPAWIAKHYDSKNIQLFCTDNDYHAYTPGIYENDGESLEVSAHRKY